MFIRVLTLLRLEWRGLFRVSEFQITKSKCQIHHIWIMSSKLDFPSCIWKFEILNRITSHQTSDARTLIKMNPKTLFTFREGIFVSVFLFQFFEIIVGVDDEIYSIHSLYDWILLNFFKCLLTLNRYNTICNTKYVGILGIYSIVNEHIILIHHIKINQLQFFFQQSWILMQLEFW